MSSDKVTLPDILTKMCKIIPLHFIRHSQDDTTQDSDEEMLVEDHVFKVKNFSINEPHKHEMILKVRYYDLFQSLLRQGSLCR